MHATAPQKSLPEPALTKGSQAALSIDATLCDLPLYTFSTTADCAVQALMNCFIRMPDLPGAIILDVGRISVLSRQQFLECWLYLGQTETFTSASIRWMLNQSNRKALILPGHTPILLGAQQALKRPFEQQNEPIVVQRTQEHYQLLDARTLNVANWQIRGIETQIRYERLQMQLLQSEKMAALGRLVDGVAHEILDPVSFIWGNLSYIADYTKQQSALIAAYESATPNPPPEIVEQREEIEFDYLRSDLPAAIASARSGAHRLRQLATSLQNFCHIDEVHPRPTDLNTLLDGTLRLLKSRLVTPISIECSYGKLPPVPCFPGQLSQVFMNIFINAIDALLDQSQPEDYISGDFDPSPAKDPLITVTTCILADKDAPTADPTESRWVSIIITDNGSGLLPNTKAQILSSFSTESRSRKETGLAMSYQIVTAKHGGRFWLRSFHECEQDLSQSDGVAFQGNRTPTGTEFEILLPLTSAEPI